MPIYEYACPKCGEFELIRKISDPPLRKCPTCKKAVKKLMSNTSFQLKGTGWYATDYAGKSSSASADATTKTDSATKKESSTKSEAASSTETKAPAAA